MGMSRMGKGRSNSRTKSIAILDYDFLMPEKLRDVQIGRLSQFFSDEYKRYLAMGGGM